MKRAFIILILTFFAGTAYASLLVDGDLLIKINFGEPSSIDDALLQEDGSRILQEDGGVLRYD